MTATKVSHEFILDVEYDIEEGAPGKPNYVSLTGAYICGTFVRLSDEDTATIEAEITEQLQEGYAPPRTLWKPPISRGAA